MSREGADLSQHGLWLVENAELSQHRSPIVVDFFSGQAIIGVERVHAAKRDLDWPPGGRQTAPLSEVGAANHDFDEDRVIRDMTALYFNLQVRQRLHQLLVKP